MTIRIVAAVLDTVRLTMYQDDGTEVVIRQGDPRLDAVVKQVVPALSAGARSVEVEMSEIRDTTYVDYQKQSKGLVRLFKVAKSALKQLFTTTETVVVGHKPEPQAHIPVTIFAETSSPSAEDEARQKLMNTIDTLGPLQTQKAMSAVEEIMAHATPVTDPNFSHDEEDTEHTMVAVVGDQVIPDVHSLKSQMHRANELGSSQGMDNFMIRISKVIAKRRHSVEDLMKFMHKGDLPIADDGSIVIYKVLLRRDGKYVDCHTRKVIQQVGSRVCMDPSLVDHDRRVECSNGLHVARRQYVGGFSGDVCVLAKVAPEDVIAVPEYDANKMRVCGYDILFELPAAAYNKLRQNRPFTDDEEGKKLLTRALRGEHEPSFEEVRITEGYGGGVVITDLRPKSDIITTEELQKYDTPEIKQEVEEVLNEVYGTALPENDGTKVVAPTIDPRAVALEAVATKQKTQAEKAEELFDTFTSAKDEDVTAAARELYDFKKKSKKGWAALGLDDQTGELLAPYLN